MQKTFDLPKLAAPAQRALAKAGITTLHQLAAWTDQEIAELHGIGKNALDTLRKALAEYQQTLRSHITVQEAIVLARSFVASQAELAPGITHHVTREPKEFPYCYYFDFEINDTNHYADPKDQPQFAGAPGFVVNKSSRQVETITWGELAELNNAP